MPTPKNLKKLIPAEEITERSTTKMGYFLLICMWIALFSLGQWSLTIIRDIPVPPKGVPQCIYDIISLLDAKSTHPNVYSDLRCYPNGGRQFSYVGDDQDFALSSDKPVFDLRSTYTKLLPAAQEIQAVFQERDTFQAQIYQIESALQIQQGQYDLALQEKMAGVKPVYTTPESSASVRESEKTLKSLRAQIAPYDEKIAMLRAKAPDVQKLQLDVKVLENAYEKALRWWQLTVNLLSFLFVGFVFGVLYNFYSRFKKSNSPHTIIFTVATFAYGILLLQVVLVGLWDIIPRVFIEQLIQFLRSFSPLLYLLQFFIPLLLVGLFGVLVYRIQRRLFSRENILKRIVADRLCPHCHNAIDIRKAYCPLCAYNIQTECPSCHTLTIKGMPFCSNCGKTIE